MGARDSKITAHSKSIEEFLYLPSRAGRVAVEEFQRRADSPLRLNWGTPNLDDYLIPMMPGDLVSILARPGMMKTTSMVHLARVFNKLLMGLRDLGIPGGERFVVYATWETLVEEFVGLRTAGNSGISLEDIGRGNADIRKLQGAIGGTILERIAVVGRSMESPTGSVHTLTDLDVVLDALTERGTPAAALIVDYLQRVPGRQGRERHEQVSENLETLKDMALKHKCPVIVGVQAKREVDDKGAAARGKKTGLKLPGLSDGQWTSNIEQTSDKIISLTRPIAYMDPEGTVTLNGEEVFPVVSNLLVLNIVKQRWGPAGASFGLNVDFRGSIITDFAPLQGYAADGPGF